MFRLATYGECFATAPLNSAESSGFKVLRHSFCCLHCGLFTFWLSKHSHSNSRLFAAKLPLWDQRRALNISDGAELCGPHATPQRKWMVFITAYPSHQSPRPLPSTLPLLKKSVSTLHDTLLSPFLPPPPHWLSLRLLHALCPLHVSNTGSSLSCVSLFPSHLFACDCVCCDWLQGLKGHAGEKVSLGASDRRRDLLHALLN